MSLSRASLPLWFLLLSVFLSLISNVQSRPSVMEKTLTSLKPKPIPLPSKGLITLACIDWGTFSCYSSLIDLTTGKASAITAPSSGFIDSGSFQSFTMRGNILTYTGGNLPNKMARFDVAQGNSLGYVRDLNIARPFFSALTSPMDGVLFAMNMSGNGHYLVPVSAVVLNATSGALLKAHPITSLNVSQYNSYVPMNQVMATAFDLVSMRHYLALNKGILVADWSKKTDSFIVDSSLVNINSLFFDSVTDTLLYLKFRVIGSYRSGSTQDLITMNCTGGPCGFKNYFMTLTCSSTARECYALEVLYPAGQWTPQTYLHTVDMNSWTESSVLNVTGGVFRASWMSSLMP